MNLIKNTQLAYGGAAIGNASNTDSASSRFDMSGWEGIRFFTTVTDCADTGVATLTVEANTADSDTGMVAVTGAAAAGTSAANDDLNGKVLMVDVYRPQKRYVQAVRTSATANIAFGECYAELYGPRKKPTSNHSTIKTATFVVGS